MTEFAWIDEADARAIHDLVLSEHGGAPGLRDEGLLKSALARARQAQAYGDAPDLIDLAAAYVADIVRNHPYVDGNKRTGFVVGVLFLELNGCRFTAGEADATKAMLDLAAETLDEAAFATSMREHTEI
jgi:death-on-curing protein